jgi:hypothetical protein
MAILRSLDGQFYEVPDDQLPKFLIPADKVKEKLGAAGQEGGQGEDPGPPPSGGQGPPIIVQIYGGAPMQGQGPGGAPAPESGTPSGGEVQPYSWWRNTWRNTFGPGWHNVWHNRW